MTFETNSLETEISTAFAILEIEISRAYMTLETNVSCSGRREGGGGGHGTCKSRDIQSTNRL